MSCLTSASAQESDTIAVPSKFTHNLETIFYFLPDEFLFLPIYQADKDVLHLEARYNYEDKNTFSAWMGYNFNFGKKFEYTITPMIGGLLGNTKGIAPGLKLDFIFNRFELYSESEYVFDSESTDNNYYYNWTDLTYSPNDWLWFGLSGQRTRLYHTDLDIQRGLLLGGSYKWLEMTGYLYNLGFDQPYFILSLSAGFPQ
jgi:hypothetical protein